MKKHLHFLLASAASVLLLMSMAAHAASANTDTKPVSIQVLGYDCDQQGSASVEADIDGSEGSNVVSPGDTITEAQDTLNWNMSLQVNVRNAGCGQWSLAASIDDFTLAGDETKSFPGSTLRIARNSSIPNSPSFERWTFQPDWVEDLPGDLPIGNPVLPAPLAQNMGDSPSLSNSISFSALGDVYTGSSPLLQSNPAAYGSPGNMSSYYSMRLFNLPTDLYLNPGNYTANLTITLQGADD